MQVTNFVLGVESEFVEAQLKKESAFLFLDTEEYVKGFLHLISPYGVYAENQHMAVNDKVCRLTAHTLFVKLINGIEPGFMLTTEKFDDSPRAIARLGVSQQPKLHHLMTYDLSEEHNSSLSILDTLHSAETETYRKVERYNKNKEIPYHLPTALGFIKSNPMIVGEHTNNIGVLFVRVAHFIDCRINCDKGEQINHMNFYNAEQLKEFLAQSDNLGEAAEWFFDGWGQILIENIDAIVERVKAIPHPAN